MSKEIGYFLGTTTSMLCIR